jgi:hypothetical protein
MNWEERSNILWEKTDQHIENISEEDMEGYLTYAIDDYLIPELEKVGTMHPNVSLIIDGKIITLRFSQNKYISFKYRRMCQFDIEWSRGVHDGFNQAAILGFPLSHFRELVEFYLSDMMGAR